MDIINRFGLTVKALRQQKGLTQEQLGERSGLNIKYIGNVERGESNPSLRSIAMLCKGLEISITDLFSLLENVPKVRENFLANYGYLSAQDQEFFENLIDSILLWHRDQNYD